MNTARAFYDRHGIVPLFPFGFGLGYIVFLLSDLMIESNGFESEDRVTASLRIANTGSRSGSSVVQLYASPRNVSVLRPEKEFEAFGTDAETIALEGKVDRTTLIQIKP